MCVLHVIQQSTSSLKNKNAFVPIANSSLFVFLRFKCDLHIIINRALSNRAPLSPGGRAQCPPGATPVLSPLGRTTCSPPPPSPPTTPCTPPSPSAPPKGGPRALLAPPPPSRAESSAKTSPRRVSISKHVFNDALCQVYSFT